MSTIDGVDMKYIIVLIVAAIVVPVHADECSNQINGYLEGLKVGSTMAAVDDAAKKNAHDQIEYITSLREYKEDCDIVELLPPLKGSKEAIEQATKAISESR